MNSPRALICLLIVNLTLCLGLASNSSAPSAVIPIVRTQGFELVDKKGATRASISVDDAEGDVVFRLRDASGAIRVKLAASGDGSGLVLLDETTNPGLQVLAKRGTTRLTMTNRNGSQRVLEP